MSIFKLVPSFVMVPDGKGHWVSTGKLMFHSTRYGISIVIESGAVNDLASIPWFLRRVININGPHRPAAAMHDKLYEISGKINGFKLTRKECDQLFLDAMLSSKDSYFKALSPDVRRYLSAAGLDKLFVGSMEPLVNKYIAKMMYWGVRIGGGFHWVNG